MTALRTAAFPTLHDVLIPRAAGERVLRNLLLAIIGSGLLWLSAKIQIPFWPVPMTMQPFVVLALGLALGWKRAGLAGALYLAEGAAGLPVFTDAHHNLLRILK